MLMPPSISVVIPVYNRGALAQPTVDSALQQDLPPDEVEIIVVDDGSTDDTFSVLQSLYGENPRVRLFSTPNGGVARARNFGLDKARGEFIAFLDHDDFWLPEKLRLQREMMREKPEAVVVYGRWREVDEVGRDIGRSPFLKEEEWVHLPVGFVFSKLLSHNFIISMTIPMIRTQTLRDAGGFDPAMVPCDDWDSWLNLAQLGEFAATEELVAVYHHHGSQQSLDEARMLNATRVLLQKHLWSRKLGALAFPKVIWIATSLRYFSKSRVPFYERARAAIASSDWAGVRRAILRGWRRFPLLLLTPQWLYIVKRLVTRNARPF